MLAPLPFAAVWITGSRCSPPSPASNSLLPFEPTRFVIFHTTPLHASTHMTGQSAATSTAKQTVPSSAHHCHLFEPSTKQNGADSSSIRWKRHPWQESPILFLTLALASLLPESEFGPCARSSISPALEPSAVGNRTNVTGCHQHDQPHSQCSPDRRRRYTNAFHCDPAPNSTK